MPPVEDIVELQRASRDDGVGGAEGMSSTRSSKLAGASIVKIYGTAAWDEPETVEEAKVRMGSLPRGMDSPRR